MDTMNSSIHKAVVKGRPALYIVLALAAYLAMSSGAAFAANSIKTEVVVGKSAVMSLPDSVSRVSIADPVVADVVVISPREIQINGKKIGSTSLIVWDKAGTKTFFDLDVVLDTKALKEQIAAIAPGDDIHYKFINPETLVLTGTVATEERKTKIRNMLLGFGQDITETELYILQGGIAKEVRSGGGTEKGFKFVLLLEVSDPLQVLLQITVASIDRNATRDLGINWSVVTDNVTVDTAVSSVTGGLTSITGLISGAPGAALSTTGIKGATFGVVHWPSGSQYLLKALASKGLAKVLAEPNLIVKSGEKGKFLAGGEVPIPIVSSITGGGGGNTVTVEYKTFGVTLNFEPLVTEAGLIKLKIDPAEVSTIAGVNVLVEGFELPTFATSRVSTSVDLREGESFVIAGLINSEWSKNLTKMPILGDLPIVGAFFRSQGMEKTERELVFVVSPKLIKPMPAGDRVQLPGSNEPTAQQLDDLRWIPMLPTYRSVDPEQLK